MKLFECEQGSEQWLKLRCGIPTASELDALVTPLWKVKTGDEPHTYLVRKLAEKWSGPIIDKTSFAMDQGNILEEIAIPWYQFETGEKIERVGFVTTDDGLAGCSPDGLLAPNGGIEFKCPERPNQVRYLLAGEVPPDYRVQVQASMFVTGRPWWKFVSYNRQLPALIVRVERDEKAQTSIAEALDGFHERFAEAWSTLVKANDGQEPPEWESVAEYLARNPETRDDEHGITP